MKQLRKIGASLLLVIMLALSADASAQCAMCTMNAENSVQNGNTQGNGLNNGILWLHHTWQLQLLVSCGTKGTGGKMSA